MGPPVPEAHPAEVMLTVVALHVVAATVLLDTNITLGAVLGVGRDIVCCLRIISTFGQPAPDSLAV